MASLSELQLDLTLNKEMLDLLNPDFQYTNIRNFPVTPPINTSALKLKDLSGTQAEESRAYFQTEVKRIQAEIYLLIQAPVLTYNYGSIYGTFSTTAASEPEAYQMFQEWLTQKESGVTPPIVTPPIVTPPIVTPPIVTPPIVTPPIVTPPIVTPPIVTPPIVTPPIVTPPVVNDSINTNMVTQQLINFNIVNGRAVGSIKFVATNNFNPYYYNKEIINLVSFKTPNGVTLLVKENRLRFTQMERDEIISYNESIQENTRITVESFVWEWMDKPAGAFSNKYTINISEKEPPKPTTSGFMGAGVAGAIAGLVLLGFIVDSKRGK